MATIRSYRAGDRDAIYRVCLETGDAGKDATALYRDPLLIGHVYSGPYGSLAPELAFVLEDGEGVGGYVLGTFDTYVFEKRLETDWWPPLREHYPEPNQPQSLDERMMRLIHHPNRTPRRITEAYPSHLHIDLLPRFQGGGWGRRMIDHLLDALRAAGSKGVHLIVGTRNERAVRFYRAYGFEEVECAGPPFDIIIFGMKL